MSVDLSVGVGDRDKFADRFPLYDGFVFAGLLTGTLMTHRKVACAEKPISLHCPADTNVVIKSARYLNFSRSPLTATAVEESPPVECDRGGAGHRSAALGDFRIRSSSNTEKCRWRDSLQVSHLIAVHIT